MITRYSSCWETRWCFTDADIEFH